MISLENLGGTLYRKYARKVLKSKSSVSDDGIYPKVVTKAVKDDEAFSNFRRNPVYNQIVESPSKVHGEAFINYLNREWPEWIEYKHILQENDKVGNPYTFLYNGGRFAPYTLQKAAEIAEMHKLIPDLFSQEKKSIAEIGVGYGGLFRLLDHMLPIKSYTMFDLPQVLKLAKKYLSCYPEIALDRIHCFKEPQTGKYDYVISNYAFCELSPQLQEIYYEKVLKPAKHGFMIYNEGTKRQFESGFDPIDLLYRLPNARIVPTESRFTSNVCTIVWGQ